jgi:hypothetical protein
VRQGLPTTAETDDLDVVLTAAISHALDDPVEAGDVAAARKNADASSHHAPTSQDWHVVIIGGPPAIRHRRTAKPRKIAMGIIADRAPLGAKATSGSAARGPASARNCRRSHLGAVTDLCAARRNHCLRRNVRIALHGHRHFDGRLGVVGTRCELAPNILGPIDTKLIQYLGRRSAIDPIYKQTHWM